jgi:hypothetical protein
MNRLFFMGNSNVSLTLNISLARSSGTNGVVDVAHVDAEVVLGSTDSQRADDTVHGEVSQALVAFSPAEVDGLGVGRGNAGQQDVAVVLRLSDRTFGFI